MGKDKKTKKFKKEQLSSVLKKRRLTQKIRRKEDDKQLKRAENETKRQEEEKKKSVSPHDLPKEKKSAPALEDLNVDDFMEGKFFGGEGEGEGGVEDEPLVHESQVASDDENDAIASATAALKLLKQQAKKGLLKAVVAQPKKEEGKKKQKKKHAEEDDGEEDDEADDAAARAGAAALGMDMEEDDESEDESEQASDEEDEGDAEAEFERHKQEMEQLAKTDPAFYEHLKQHDSELLNFGETAADDVDAQMDEAAKSIADQLDGAINTKDITAVTDDMLLALRKAVLKDRSLRSLFKLIRLFRSAVHVNDDAKAGDKDKRLSDVKFANPKVYNGLMKLALKQGPLVFSYHLSFKDVKTQEEEAGAGAGAESQKKPALKNHPRFKKVQEALKSFLTNLCLFLDQLVDTKMIKFMLASMEKAIPLFEPFPKLAKRLLKSLLRVWAEGEDAARVEAFLRIRQMSLELPPKMELLEQSLKGIYLSFVRHSRHVNSTTLPGIQFMSNCVVELYSLDPVASYQHAFVYIRQLAIHLRNALTKKEDKAHQSVYNWQFVNCLRVWAQCLSTHGATPEAPLYHLVYPFIQVCLSVIQLVPSARYFPLRFEVARYINQVCSKTGLFVPLSPYLQAVVTSAEMSRKPRPGLKKLPSLRLLLKVSKDVVRTKAFQDAALGDALDILLRHLAIYSWSAAFPELVLPLQVSLKRLSKSTKGNTLRKSLSQFLAKVDMNAQFIHQKRNAINFAPKDMLQNGVSGIDTFRAAVQKEEQNAGKKTTQQSPLERFVEMAGSEDVKLSTTESDLSLERQVLDDAERSDNEEGQDESKSKAKAAEEGEGEEEEGEEEGEEEEEEEEGQSKKKAGKKAQKRAREGEQGDGQAKKRAKKAAAAAPAAKKSGSSSTMLDEVTDFAFSDDDE